jgi:excalibur calcium-binding domain-containing protein
MLDVHWGTSSRVDLFACPRPVDRGRSSAKRYPSRLPGRFHDAPVNRGGPVDEAIGMRLLLVTAALLLALAACNDEDKPSVQYSNCEEAKKAGAAPLHRGDPGYRTSLDRDGDGVACDK